MYHPKVTEARGKITPEDAGRVAVKYRIHERSVDADAGAPAFLGARHGNRAVPDHPAQSLGNGQCQVSDTASREQEYKLHKQQQKRPKNEDALLTLCGCDVPRPVMAW